MQFVDLKRQYRLYHSCIDQAISRVLSHAQFISGPEVGELEQVLGAYVGSEAVAVSSGTEALHISLMALGIGPGDEVITTPFTWISTAAAILLVGAKPVFVDIEEGTFNLDPKKVEAAITSATKAILPVSLFGQAAEYKMFLKFGLPVIEDGAQSFGAQQNGIKSCGITDLAITSFFPAKPLGCYGDGGCIFAKDPKMAERLRAIRNHGNIGGGHHQHLGMTGRLDTMQAAILLAKWPNFHSELEGRRRLADRYSQALKDVCCVPLVRSGNTHAYAQYTIQTEHRDALAAALAEREIPCAIYYPRPLYQQPVFHHLGCREQDYPVTERASRRVISLPIHPWLTDNEQDSVIAVVREVCRDQ